MRRKELEHYTSIGVARFFPVSYRRRPGRKKRRGGTENTASIVALGKAAELAGA